MAQKPETLDDLRRRIDALDDALHDLLIERSEVNRRIGAIKSKARDGGPAWRPGREASVLRRLVARHRGPLPRAALVRIWRELMTAFLRLQSDFSVAAYAGTDADDGACREIARDHFGGLTTIRTNESARQVLSEVGEGRAAIGVLPLPQQDDPQPWWPMLLGPDAETPRVIARLPFVPGALTRTQTEALVVGRVPLEPSGRDRSLIVIEMVEPVSRATLRRQLDAAGLDAAFLQIGFAQGGEHTLNLVDVDPTDAKLDKLAKGLGKRAGPIRSIGGYAVPLTLEELGAKEGQEAAQ
jgi:chorismate mutase/prephenate dehydratase